MRKGRALFSAVEFWIIAALFLTGAAFLGLYFSMEARERLAMWLLNGGGPALFKIGLATVAVALVLGVGFAVIQRGGYIRLKGRGFSIHEALVRNATIEFWIREFPNESIPREIYCSRGKIEIITENLKADLDEIEGRLGFFLANNLGYERDFYITVSRL